MGGAGQLPTGSSFGNPMPPGQTPPGQMPPGQQQAGPFAQPTGYTPQPLQQQYTGYPMQSQPAGSHQPSQPLHSQYTGYPAQPAPLPQTQQNLPASAPPVPSIPPQFQQHQLQQHQLPQLHQQPAVAPPPSRSAGFSPPPASSLSTPAAVKPQPTGFSEMAASFQAAGSSNPQPRQPEKPSGKIPNIRLSFITAQDQAKFETLFKSAVGDESTAMSGEKARDLLMRSRLDGDSLSHIW